MIVTKEELKPKFKNFETPTEDDFWNLIDSLAHVDDLNTLLDQFNSMNLDLGDLSTLSDRIGVVELQGLKEILTIGNITDGSDIIVSTGDNLKTNTIITDGNLSITTTPIIGQDGNININGPQGSFNITDPSIFSFYNTTTPELLFQVNGEDDINYSFKVLDMGINKIINVTDPTNDQDVATKKYVDDNSSNINLLSDIGNCGNDVLNQGSILTYIGTLWQPTTYSFVHSLNDLDDVDSKLPSANDLLVYDGSNWVNKTTPYLTLNNVSSMINSKTYSLEELTDTDISGISLNDAITWDGSNWVNGPAASNFDGYIRKSTGDFAVGTLLTLDSVDDGQGNGSTIVWANNSTTKGDGTDIGSITIKDMNTDRAALNISLRDSSGGVNPIITIETVNNTIDFNNYESKNFVIQQGAPVNKVNGSIWMEV